MAEKNGSSGGDRKDSHAKNNVLHQNETGFAIGHHFVEELTGSAPMVNLDGNSYEEPRDKSSGRPPKKRNSP